MFGSIPNPLPPFPRREGGDRVTRTQHRQQSPSPSIGAAAQQPGDRGEGRRLSQGPTRERRAPVLLVALGAVVAGLLLGGVAPAARTASADTTTLTRTGDDLLLTNGALTVRYSLRTGTAHFDWEAGASVRRGYAAAELVTAEGRAQVHSTNLTRRSYTSEEVGGPLGRGLRLAVTGESRALAVTLTQSITVFDDQPFALLRTEVGRLPEAQGTPVAAHQIEVLAASGFTQPEGWVAIANAADQRLYKAPFYNDHDFEVPLAATQRDTVSYWLTALFDAAGGRGLVAGATETAVWKSAAWFDGPTQAISLHSGARSPIDRADHTAVRGERVASAEFLIGGYADYRAGMADLMSVLALNEPPLPPPSLPPVIGWNPWYQYDFGATEQIVRGVTDFLADNWAHLGYRYVNLDAGWNVMDGDWRASPERFPGGMGALTSYIHRRGLLAGSYFIPFAVNPAMLDAPIPGTPYTFRDATLKDRRGAPVIADILNWEYVLDGTHPGTQSYLYNAAASIAADGFDFVKLDFLQIGTQEGQHHDPAATGMAAFHRGMESVRDGFASAGRPIYLSAAISPLYLHQYVHARRVGNDVIFGQAREAQNVSLSWFTDLLYHRNDPDNVVLREDWFPGYTEGLARMHTTMAAMGGTLFILGDDPRYLSPERAALVTNPEILDLAREGVGARPLDVRAMPAPVWAIRLRDGSVAVGVFNWDIRPARYTIPLVSLGLDPSRAYRVRDVWNPEAGGTATGNYTVDVGALSVALLRLGP